MSAGRRPRGHPPIWGHLRTFLAFDVLVRWLERSGYEVTHVRNVTDIDDKILVKSAEAGARWWAWSLRFEREFQDVLDRVGEPTPPQLRAARHGSRSRDDRADAAADRAGGARLRRRRRLGLLRRRLPAVLRLPDPTEPRGHAGCRRGDGTRQAGSAGLRAVEGREADGAGDRLLGHPPFGRAGRAGTSNAPP